MLQTTFHVFSFFQILNHKLFMRRRGVPRVYPAQHRLVNFLSEDNLGRASYDGKKMHHFRMTRFEFTIINIFIGVSFPMFEMCKLLCGLRFFPNCGIPNKLIAYAYVCMLSLTINSRTLTWLKLC